MYPPMIPRSRGVFEKRLSLSKNSLKLIVVYKNQEFYYNYTVVEDKRL